MTDAIEKGWRQFLFSANRTPSLLNLLTCRNDKNVKLIY